MSQHHSSAPLAVSAVQSPQERLAALIADARNLPTMPTVAVQVANVVDSPSSSARNVANALAGDPLLTAKVLRMANSVFYGAPRTVSTVTDAIVLLGMQTIRSLAMAASCHETLDRELHHYGLLRGELWRHAFCVAYASQAIAVKLRYPSPEEAFVAGLLHDLGKVVIDSNASGAFEEVLARASKADTTFDQSERLVIGFDHAQVGAALLQSWRLPEQLVYAVQFHHAPSREAVWSKLTAMVHVADTICMTLGIGIGVDGLRYGFEADSLARLKLREQAIEQIAEKVLDCLADPDVIRS